MGMHARFRWRSLAFLVLSPFLGVVGQESTHKITFTFDYDFSVTPACVPGVKHDPCVQQFNFYDISVGLSKRMKIGSTPAPAGAKGPVKGISATTEPLLLGSGRHKLAVAAQLSDGPESDLRKCAIIVLVP
jgi:hypothetical protein